MLRQSATTLHVDTRGRGLHEITAAVTGWVDGVGLQEGLLTLFIDAVFSPNSSSLPPLNCS